MSSAFRTLEEARGRVEAEALQSRENVPPHAPTADEVRLTKLNLALIDSDDPIAGKIKTTGLGLVHNNKLDGPNDVRFVRLGPVEALSRGVGDTWYIAVKTFDFIGQLLTGRGDYQQLSGPIGIAKVSGQVLVFLGVVALINLAAVLSVSIGLLNLFPIPMLDGGHLLYYGIEAVRGRPLGERAQELGFRIGFALVVGLMLFATWNDLTKFRLF